MVRVLDVDTQGATRTRSAILPRNFLVVTAKDRGTSESASYGFWDDAETVSVDVVNEDGATETLSFAGDGAVLSIPPIPMRIGLEVRTIEISLSAIHPAVQDMVRGSDPRGAKIELYRGLLDPGTNVLVAPPRIRFLGKVNETPIATAAAGGESTITLRVVSHTRELTRTNPAKKSDAQQQLRDGDRFRRYAGVVADWDIWWGEAEGSA